MTEFEKQVKKIKKTAKELINLKTLYSGLEFIYGKDWLDYDIVWQTEKKLKKVELNFKKSLKKFLDVYKNDFYNFLQQIDLQSTKFKKKIPSDEYKEFKNSVAVIISFIDKNFDAETDLFTVLDFYFKYKKLFFYP